MNCQLTPLGWKPVVAIDECQVLDEVFGWGGFRSSYGNATWTWLIAALDPKWANVNITVNKTELQSAMRSRALKRCKTVAVKGCTEQSN